jgi:hypothetical protein
MILRILGLLLGAASRVARPIDRAPLATFAQELVDLDRSTATR